MKALLLSHPVHLLLPSKKDIVLPEAEEDHVIMTVNYAFASQVRKILRSARRKLCASIAIGEERRGERERERGERRVGKSVPVSVCARLADNFPVQ